MAAVSGAVSRSPCRTAPVSPKKARPKIQKRKLRNGSITEACDTPGS
jgi:hypothetical protein